MGNAGSWCYSKAVKIAEPDGLNSRTAARHIKAVPGRKTDLEDRRKGLRVAWKQGRSRSRVREIVS